LDFSATFFIGVNNSKTLWNSTMNSTCGTTRKKNGDSPVSMVKFHQTLDRKKHQNLSSVLGRAECELNKLHACILEHLSFEKAFEVISCLMRSFDSNIDNVSGFNLLHLCLHQKPKTHISSALPVNMI
jgi:hypothetical protein